VGKGTNEEVIKKGASAPFFIYQKMPDFLIQLLSNNSSILAHFLLSGP
jgi:hypothetical protein